MAELQINSQVLYGTPIVSLQGELDSYSSGRVRQILDALVDGDRPVILIDVVGLEYIDSSGLGVLVSALKRVGDRAGTLALIGPTNDVARVLRVTGLDRLFKVYIDEADALSGIGCGQI